MRKIISTILILFIGILFSNKSKAQSWSLFGTNTCTGLEKIGGTSSSSSPLEIHMDGPYSIEFYTNAIKHMELTSAGDLTVTGNIISNSSINLPNITSKYQIGGIDVLWCNGNASNLFVGNGNVTMAKNLTVANVILHNNKTDIDLLQTITDLQNQLTLLQKRLDKIEKTNH